METGSLQTAAAPFFPCKGLIEKMKNILTSLVGVVFWTGVMLAPYSACAYEKETVAKLQSTCSHTISSVSTPEDIEAAYNCRGYIQAVMENFYGVFTCPQYENLTVEHQIELFISWAKDHPEESSKDAFYGVNKSSADIIRKCPCPPPPGGGLFGYAGGMYDCRQ